MSYYRVATPEEIGRMSARQVFWYETSLVPVFLMPDGKIRSQGLAGAFGGVRGAIAQLVTQEWLDEHKEWIKKHGQDPIS